MYGSDYLAARFGVSPTTVRAHLRKLGYGVGTTGVYEFSESVIGTVEKQLAESMRRDPVVKATQVPLPETFMIDSSTFANGGLISLPIEDSVSVSGAVSSPATPSRGQRVSAVLVENKRNILFIVLALLSAILGVDLAL